MAKSKIRQVDGRVNFPQVEDNITKFWKENKIFEKSVEQRPEDNTYRFLDGPPFPSGMPHYGHLCWSVGKDVIPRYQTMKGKRVRRVWGWDCHGIAVESKVNKELGIGTRKEIEEFGIENYVKECRKYVERQIANWGWYIEKLGRWVDMEDAYYTMYPEYHESVLWAFKQLWDKGHIYKGKRVSLYSVETCTPVSDFEVAEGNDYRDIEELSVFPKFKLLTKGKDLEKFKEDVYLLAWTTTPWTLPSNFALAVNPSEEYVLVRSEEQLYVLAKARLEYTFTDSADKVEVLATFRGDSLEHLQYEPLFDYFKSDVTDKDFKVYLYKGVTIEDGTGVLHVAPAYGEEDFNLGREFGLSDFASIDEEGKMTVGEWNGVYLRKASELIAQFLLDEKQLLRTEMYTHRLPFYRGSEPLIYMAQDQYFINIQDVKKRMLELNENINWTPGDVKTGRFPAIVESAPDWAISRNRYWATIMPVWKSEKGDELVVGSFEEMAQYTDQIVKKEENGRDVYYLKSTDEKLTAHRDKCDSIVLTKDGQTFHRVEEVLDVWLDSGCAPFAEFHYPMENKDMFGDQAFKPADFIIEGAGMVRAWFNVLHRVSTLVFDSHAFQNVISGGNFSGNDGRKMSKTYGNYSDPKDVLSNLGGETLRLYLAGSAVMGGGDADWSDEVLVEQQKNVLIPFWNTYRYLALYAGINDWSPKNTEFPTSNVLDRWLETYLNKVAKDYSEALDKYNLPASAKLIQPTIDALSTWWIRRSRERFAAGDPEALQAMYAAMVKISKIFAPQIPFLSEEVYQNLVVNTGVKGGLESVHLEMFPDSGEVDQKLLEEMELVRAAASVGLKLREDARLKLRQPLAKAWVPVENKELQELLKSELNVKEIEFSKETVTGEGYLTSAAEELVCVTLDSTLTDELREEGLFNELARQIQDMRKKGGFQVGEKVSVKYNSTDKSVLKVMSDYLKNIMDKVDASEVTLDSKLEVKEVMVNGLRVQLELARL